MSPTLFPLVVRLLAAEPSTSDELTVERVLNGGAALITKAAYPTAT